MMLVRDWSLMMAGCYVRYTAVPNAITVVCTVYRRCSQGGRRHVHLQVIAGVQVCTVCIAGVVKEDEGTYTCR